MPYPNVPKDKWGAMDSCVKDVEAEGYSKERAIAICHASIVEAEGPAVEPAQRQRHIVEADIAPRGAGAKFAGREWEVTIIGAESPASIVTHKGTEYVRSKNDRLYSCTGLRDSVQEWDGIDVYDNHLTDEEFEERAGMRSVAKEWLGSIVNPRWDAGARKLIGTFKLVDEPTATKLKNAWDQDVLHTIGLSIDTKPQETVAVVEGKRQPLVEGFEKIFSVDVVAKPAAGGAFNRLIAAQTTGGNSMPATLEALEARIAQLEKALAAQEQEVPAPVETPEEAVEEVVAAVEEVAEEAPPEASPAQVAQVAADAAQVVADEIAEEEEQAPAPAPEAEDVSERIHKLECKLLLAEKLLAAKLGAKDKAVVEAAFAGRTFEAAEVDVMVKRVKEAAAGRDPSGRVNGVGGTRISVGMNERDVRETALMRLLMGNSKFRALESIDADYVRDRWSPSYKAWIKAGRPKDRYRRLSSWTYDFGDPFTDPERFYEAATTSSMSSIVKNTLNLILAADYSVKEEWWDPIVTTEEVDTIETATLARVFSLSSTLSVVPEGQAYTELTWADEEETAAFVKKGNFVGITLETMLKDHLNVVRSIPQRLSNIWYNTLSALVSGVFTVNTNTGPALASTAALFNATAVSSATGHANLLTTPLSYAAYGASRTAMRKQTDYLLGAGRKLLIVPRYILVPVDLESTAQPIFDTEFKPGSANNDINPYYKECQVIVVPDWTDANNWALVADKAQFPAIYLLFLTGRRVPELYSADNETAGAMFTNDTLRYKVRMLTWRYSSTYECAPVSDFRPLHKNNVA